MYTKILRKKEQHTICKSNGMSAQLLEFKFYFFHIPAVQTLITPNCVPQFPYLLNGDYIVLMRTLYAKYVNK